MQYVKKKFEELKAYLRSRRLTFRGKKPKFMGKISFAYLKSRKFLINLLLIIGVYLSLFLILIISLNVITQHYKDPVKVPDFTNYSVARAKHILKNKDLEGVIFDSVYRADLRSGMIIDQHPKPDAKVKRGRKVYFTISASSPEKIPMPNLIGITLREAEAKLAAAGLRLGNISERYDMAVNAVLDMTVYGERLRAGDTVKKDTPVDLVIGTNQSGDYYPVPNLIGLNAEDADLRSAELDFRTLPIPDDPDIISGELPIYVYKQDPAPGQEHAHGDYIWIYLTTDTALIRNYRPTDSLSIPVPEIYNANDSEYLEDESGYDFDPSGF